MTWNHLRFWGKSGKGDLAHTYHPVAFHCLDVAACGRVLLETQPLLRRRLEAVSGLEGDGLMGWVSFLLGFHDLGKLADGFQNLRPDLLQRLQERTSTAQHDLLGFRLWEDLLQDEVVGEDEDIHQLIGPWLRAAAGHHGSPPRRSSPEESLKRQFPSESMAHAREVVGWLAGRFLPDGLPFAVEPYEEQCRNFGRASWLFAGLAVAADWIGSNSLWFPFCEDRLSLDEYWETKAVPQAQIAVERTGFTEIPPSVTTGLTALWPNYTHTPLQTLAESVELSEGPQLFIVEEVTGGGKTEAALVLAHRLLERRLGSGLYVALPTMATANAMYERVLKVYEKLFENEGASLVLAHSKRHLMDRLQESPPDEAYDRDEPTASQVASAWLSDSRKKALLAQVGVGTIDQALLGVLPVRHQSLRLWGAAGKILIVDEVHACDAYVGTLLRNLLRFHAAFGGSAILLSATLPSVQRRKLLEAFADGCDTELPDESLSQAYPLTTQWAADRFESFPTEARTEARRRVEIEPLRSPSRAMGRIVETAQAGRCACWVRNTVDGGAFVYRDHGRLWLTARWLEEHGGFQMPEDARELIEYVYDEDGKDRMPDALRDVSDKQEGETHAEVALANLNGLSLNEGYQVTTSQWPEDAYVPTRLGEPTVTLRLIRKTETGYEPWHADVPHAWEMSQVQVREFLAAEEALPNDLIEELKSRMSDEGKFVVLAVAESTAGSWTTATRSSRGETNRWTYDETTGLRRIREDP